MLREVILQNRIILRLLTDLEPIVLDIEPILLDMSRVGNWPIYYDPPLISEVS